MPAANLIVNAPDNEAPEHEHAPMAVPTNPSIHDPLHTVAHEPAPALEMAYPLYVPDGTAYPAYGPDFLMEQYHIPDIYLSTAFNPLNTADAVCRSLCYPPIL